MTTTTTHTPAVQRIITAAERAGLHPRLDTTPYRGSLELHLDAKNGPESPFGTVWIGAHTGRVLRAALRHGNTGPSRRFEDGRVCDHMLHALRALPTVS